MSLIEQVMNESKTLNKKSKKLKEATSSDDFVEDISHLGNEVFITLRGREFPRQLQNKFILAITQGNALDRVDVLYNNYEMITIDNDAELNKVPIDIADLRGNLGLVDLVIMPSPRKNDCFTLGAAFDFISENRNEVIEQLVGIQDIDAIDYIGYIEVKDVLTTFSDNSDLTNFPEGWDLEALASQSMTFLQTIFNSYF